MPSFGLAHGSVMSPRKRFENLPADQRALILAAAAEEFAREGFEEASINRIIAAAGLSKGGLYYYFDDKEDLYAAVMDDVMDRAFAVVADLPRPTDAASYWATLRVGMDRLNAAFLHDTQLAELGRGLYRRSGKNPTYERLLERARGWVRFLVEEGQRVGAVRSDVPVAFLAETVTGMVLAMDRWVVMSLERVGASELLEIAPKTIELLRDFLSPKRAERAPTTETRAPKGRGRGKDPR